MNASGRFEQINERLLFLARPLPRDGAPDPLESPLEPGLERALVGARQLTEGLEGRAPLRQLRCAFHQSGPRVRGEFLYVLTERRGSSFVRLEACRVIRVGLLALSKDRVAVPAEFFP